jgi:hypothetical protein
MFSLSTKIGRFSYVFKCMNASLENHMTLKTWLPVALCSPSQKRDVSPFHFPTVADSVAFCAEATSIRDRFSTQGWLSARYVVPNAAHCLPCCIELISCEEMRHVYIFLHIYHTHTSFFFLLTPFICNVGPF